MRHLFFSTVLSFSLIHSSERPINGDACQREVLDDEAAFERNAWAHNCGYLPARMITWLFIHDLWMAFERPGAPLDSELPCGDDWGQPVGFCRAVVD